MAQKEIATLPRQSTFVRFPITDRGFPHYTRVFNYGPHGEMLKGKKVLDLGAGSSNFAQEANLIPGTLVIQLDISYSDFPPTNRGDKICGAIQQLPFKDGIFDETIASFSTIYLPKDDIEQSLKEMLRVTKKGGKVKIFPVIPIHFFDSTTLYPNVKLNRYDDSYLTLEVTKEDSDDLQQLVGILSMLNLHEQHMKQLSHNEGSIQQISSSIFDKIIVGENLNLIDQKTNIEKINNKKIIWSQR